MIEWLSLPSLTGYAVYGLAQSLCVIKTRVFTIVTDPIYIH